jgi:hypothetical protein
MNEDASPPCADREPRFLQWLQAQQPRISSMLRLDNEQDREDVWAQTQLNAWRDFRNKDWPIDEADWGAWLWPIARQTRAELRRCKREVRWRRNVTFDKALVEKHAVDGQAQMEWLDFLDRCGRYLDALPARERVALSYKLGQMTMPEAEQAIGLAAPTIRKEAAPAHRRLRAWVGLAGGLLAWLQAGIRRLRTSATVQLAGAGAVLSTAVALALVLDPAPVTGAVANATPPVTVNTQPGDPPAAQAGVAVVRRVAPGQPVEGATVPGRSPHSVDAVPAARGTTVPAAHVGPQGGHNAPAVPASARAVVEATRPVRTRAEAAALAAVLPATTAGGPVPLPLADSTTISEPELPPPPSALARALAAYDEARQVEAPAERGAALRSFTDAWPGSSLRLDATLAEAEAWLSAGKPREALRAIDGLGGTTPPAALQADILKLRAQALLIERDCGALRQLRRDADGATRQTLRAMEAKCAPR